MSTVIYRIPDLQCNCDNRFEIWCSSEGKISIIRGARHASPTHFACDSCNANYPYAGQYLTDVIDCAYMCHFWKCSGPNCDSFVVSWLKLNGEAITNGWTDTLTSLCPACGAYDQCENCSSPKVICKCRSIDQQNSVSLRSARNK